MCVYTRNELVIQGPCFRPHVLLEQNPLFPFTDHTGEDHNPSEIETG